MLIAKSRLTYVGRIILKWRYTVSLSVAIEKYISRAEISGRKLFVLTLKYSIESVIYLYRKHKYSLALKITSTQ